MIFRKIFAHPRPYHYFPPPDDVVDRAADPAEMVGTTISSPVGDDREEQHVHQHKQPFPRPHPDDPFVPPSPPTLPTRAPDIDSLGTSSSTDPASSSASPSMSAGDLVLLSRAVAAEDESELLGADDPYDDSDTLAAALRGSLSEPNSPPAQPIPQSRLPRKTPGPHPGSGLLIVPSGRGPASAGDGGDYLPLGVPQHGAAYRYISAPRRISPHRVKRKRGDPQRIGNHFVTAGAGPPGGSSGSLMNGGSHNGGGNVHPYLLPFSSTAGNRGEYGRRQGGLQGTIGEQPQSQRIAGGEQQRYVARMNMFNNVG